MASCYFLKSLVASKIQVLAVVNQLLCFQDGVFNDTLICWFNELKRLQSSLITILQFLSPFVGKLSMPQKV